MNSADLARERREAEARADQFLDVGPFRLGGRAVIETLRRMFRWSPGAVSRDGTTSTDLDNAVNPEAIDAQEYQVLVAEREELCARVAELRRHLERLEAEAARSPAMQLAAGAALLRDAERRRREAGDRP